ncbi:hypothetical protein BDFB_006421 [Asbolus verrucosus]|uniref:Uncharacterized protein n=1 Tax=Asbolus verrucosus TaxID=1661398 RepID=A0A482VA98_ASBVE|nr:hypothetical protein BDFB_006421 [Asbolus verrucosus]
MNLLQDVQRHLAFLIGQMKLSSLYFLTP